jgi:streptomycin 6-kinase
MTGAKHRVFGTRSPTVRSRWPYAAPVPPAATDDEWVEQLPAAIAACAERWGLTAGAPLAGGLVGHVVACTTREGDAAALKLNPPSSDEFAGTPEQEAAALRAWGGRGAVELLAFAPDQRALLTRRAVPGTALPAGAEHAALTAVADVLRQLFDATIPPVAFAPLAEAVDRNLVRKLGVAGDERAPFEALIEKARASARSLATSASRELLLHGDLMDKNLLRHNDRVVAIDPMPCVGDPHADIGFWAATRIPAADLDARAADLARRLTCDAVRASRWAAVFAVGAACESWRPDTPELRAWVGSPRAADLLSG